jgi:cytochrome P450
MNPEIHDSPQEFNPARYLNKPLPAADYLNTGDPYDRNYFTYGAGRQVCPGIHVAEKSLYINIVRLQTLWGFDIRRSKGANGKLEDPDTTMVRGFLSMPFKYRCHLSPRSAKHAVVIRDSFKQAQKEGLESM